MSETLTVELPDELARRARSMAAAANRRLEDAVVDWISQAIGAPDVESLSDGEVLTRCDSALAADLQEELSGLLSHARESTLDAAERVRLDEIMALYRRGMVQKAHAWKEAVVRGLRQPIGGGDDAA